MKMHDLGNPDGECVLLIHPMSASYEVMHAWFAGLIADGKYRVLVPDLSAHGEDAGPYASAAADAAAIADWLARQGIRRIALGYGASLGAITLFSLLGTDSVEIGLAWLEGMSFYERGSLMEHMVFCMTASEQRRYRNDPSRALRELSDLYGLETGALMAQSYPRISPEDTKRMVHACFSVKLPPLAEEAQRRLVFSFGSKDAQYARAKRILPVRYPAAKVLVWDGFGHCAYPATHSEAFTAKLLETPSTPDSANVDTGDGGYRPRL